MIGNAANVEPVGGDLRGGRQLRLHARQRGVDALQRLEHVDLPGEEQIDFRGSAAGDRPDVLEPLHAVHRLLDRPRDGHLHLIDRRDAVVDADDDAREVDFGEDGDRNRRREVDADGDQREDDEDDRLAVARGPVLAARSRRPVRRASVLCPRRLRPSRRPPSRPASSRAPCVLSSSPRPPCVTTRCPTSTPATICTISGSRTPICTTFSCAMFLSSTMSTIVSPSALGRTAGAGISVAPSSVAATIDTWTDWPACSRSPGLSACTHTCTVVLFGSDAGLTMVTLPVTELAAVGRRDRRLVADLDVPRLVLRHVDARDDLRHVHHREQRRAGRGHLARIERPIGDDAGDRAADLRVARLRLRALVVAFGRLDLRRRGLDLLLAADALQRLQMLLRGVERRLRLRVARPAPRRRASARARRP